MRHEIPHTGPEWIGPIKRDDATMDIEGGDSDVVQIHYRDATVAHFREAYRHRSDKASPDYDPEEAMMLGEWLRFLEAVAASQGRSLREDCRVVETVEAIAKSPSATRGLAN